MTSAAQFPDPRDNWLKPYIRVQAVADASIRKILAEAARDAADAAQTLSTSDGIGAQVRLSQFKAVESTLRMTISTLFAAIGDRVASDRESAVAAALKAGFNWDKVLFRLGLSARQFSALRGSFEAAAERNVQNFLNHFTSRRIPLSTQVYKSQKIADDWAVNRVQRAIASGKSARELAKDVRDLIRPDTPGGVSYAAFRLARTEINAAFHETTVRSNEEKPWVAGMDWKLSKSHHVPDICDLIAKKSPYKKGTVPSKRDSHPQCMCFIVPQTMDEDAFVESLKKGKFDKYLNETYGF